MGVRLLVRSCWADGSDGDAVFEFDQTRITIGRGRGADVRLPNRAVSARHATIEHTGKGYTLVDHETTNGTLVNGARLVSGRAKPLREADRIELGGFTLLFHAGISVTRATSRERTASLARRLARDSLDASTELLCPRLVVLNGPMADRTVTLPAPPARFVVGRDEGCELALDDADLSREHAELEVTLDGVWARDLGSKNGTWVGERRIDERLLDDREEIRVGSTVLRFDDPAEAELGALEEGEDLETDVPRWQADPEPEPELPDPDRPAPASPRQAPPPPRGRHGGSVAPEDLVIYVLAAAVFALSVLALIWLLRSG